MKITYYVPYCEKLGKFLKETDPKKCFSIKDDNIEINLDVLTDNIKEGKRYQNDAGTVFYTYSFIEHFYPSIFKQRYNEVFLQCQTKVNDFLQGLGCCFVKNEEELIINTDTKFPRMTFKKVNPHQIRGIFKTKMIKKTNAHCVTCGMSLSLIPFVIVGNKPSIKICHFCLEKFLKNQIEQIHKSYDPVWLEKFSEHVQKERFIHNL